MTSGLRKWHKYMWLIIVVIVPLVIIFSIKNRTAFSSESNIVLKTEALKNGESHHLENDFIRVTLANNSIEILLKQPLKSASSVVYSLNEKGLKDVFIGQLSTVGFYNYKLTEPFNGIVIYDILKEKEIMKLTF